MGKRPGVWGDQAYRGQRAVIREHAPKARDFTNRRYRHRGIVDEVERRKNRTKSKVRARVEHAIGVIKRVFGFAKVRYRGLKKNTHRLAPRIGPEQPEQGGEKKGGDPELRATA
jgi:IS5 family transposase